MAYEDDPSVEAAMVTDPTGMPLIRWGVILGCIVLGFGLLMLAWMLWPSPAVGSNMTAVRDHLAWYLGISAIGALFIGGAIGGSVSRGRRARTSAMTSGAGRVEDVPARRHRVDDTVVVDGETTEPPRRVS